MYYDFIVTLIEYWLYRDIEYILALSWHHIKLSWMPWLSMGRSDWWRRADGADGADGAVTPIQQRWVRAAGRRSHSFFCRPEKTWRMKPRHWRDRTINPGINPTRSSEKKNPEEPSTLCFSRQNRSSRTRPVSREKDPLYFSLTEQRWWSVGEVRQRFDRDSLALHCDFHTTSPGFWFCSRALGAVGGKLVAGKPSRVMLVWAEQLSLRPCELQSQTVGSVGSVWVGL